MFFYYLSRAFFKALHATRAFFIIEYGQVVYHGYSAVGTYPCAHAAAYAADFAERHRFFAFACGRARAVYLCRCGDALYDKLRTFLHACSARRAQSFVYESHTVFDLYRAYGADLFACTAAETAVRAHLAASEVHLSVEAAFVAYILVFVFGIDSAVAFYHGDGRLARREFDARKFCDDFLFFVGRDLAVVEGSLAASQAFCKTFAAAVSATAAVCSRQMFEYFYDFFVFLYMADFCDYKNKYCENDGKSSYDAEHQTYFIPLYRSGY